MRSSGGPLCATELFQRSLLEAQFANSAPDSALYIVDDDDAITTIMVATGTNVVNVVVGGDDIASVQNLMLCIATSTDQGQNADEAQKERASQHIASLKKSSNDAPTERQRRYPMHPAALAISTIGTVRQIISKNGRLVNKCEVRVGAVPFLLDFLPGLKYSGGLLFTINGDIMSTADTAPLSSDNNSAEWELYMDTVEIKGSIIPILRNLLDSENAAL